MITVLKSKIRDIFVSGAVPNYEGSVILLPRLLKTDKENL
jgi:aspartate 1-decarboxylase